MTMDNKKSELLQEYEDFLSGSTPVPHDVNERILTRLKKLINPNPWLVFSKLLGFQALIGFLSLSVCHQFGINPFNTANFLSNWMMSFGGHGFCMVGCGVFFVGLNLTLAGYFMTFEEVGVIKKNEFVQVFSLGVISLMLFALFGAELVLTFAGLWLLGALIGGFVATETVFRFKTI